MIGHHALLVQPSKTLASEAVVLLVQVDLSLLRKMAGTLECSE